MVGPLVSVIVPVYMIERYVGQCLESISEQTYKNLEIIVVDDGTPDRSAAICDLYARKDERIRVIHQSNGGLVNARKAGLRISRGEYIACVDGDDWIGPDYIETLCAAAEETDADAVCSGFTRDLYSSSARFVNVLPSGIYEDRKRESLFRKMLSCGPFFRSGVSTYLWGKLFRREILHTWQMAVDERISIGEDAAVTYPALLQCRRVSLIGCTAYHYRQREDSMLKQTSDYSDELFRLRVLRDYLLRWARDPSLPYDLLPQVTDYLLSLALTRFGGRTVYGNNSVFGADCSGRRVVVYSAGTFGQQLVKCLQASNSGFLSGWVDDDFREYRRCGLDVDPVESIGRLSYDAVLIATVDSFFAERAKVRLLDIGVPRNQIKTICVPENRKQLTDWFLDVAV